MESASQIQILNKAVHISLHANVIGKGINSSSSSLQSTENNKKLDSLALVRQLAYEKEN